MTEPLSSSRLDALNCPRRYYHSYIQGLEPDVEVSELLHSGSVGHVALHMWYQSNKDDSWALQAACDAWGDFLPRATIEVDGETKKNQYAYLSWPHMKGVLQRYFDYNRTQGIQFEPTTIGDYAAEELITVTLPNGIEYRSRIDFPCRDQAGGLYIYDYKFTTGNLGDYFFDGHRLSNQLRGYCATAQVLTGEAPRGAGINGIYMGDKNRKPEVAHQQKKWEFLDWSLQEFCDNVYGAEEEIDWRTGDGEWGAEIDSWPQRASKVNCGYCPFKGVCGANPRVRQEILEQDFRKKERQLPVVRA